MALSAAAHRTIRWLLALAAIALLVTAGLVADTGGSDGTAAGSEGVERLQPTEGSEVLRQTPIQVDLEVGWGLGSLALNGTEIPEEEWDVTAELALWEYTPGEGKTVEELAADRNCVAASIFQLADPDQTHDLAWCFTAA